MASTSMRYEKREQRATLLGVLVSSTMLKKVLFWGLVFLFVSTFSVTGANFC